MYVLKGTTLIPLAINFFPLYSLASRSVLVLDILSSGEMSAHFFLLFARVQQGLGQGSQEPGVTPALAVPAPTISIPWGLTMEEFNLPLITEAQRKLQSGVNIPLLSTLLRGRGLHRGAMAHGHQRCLTYSA